MIFEYLDTPLCSVGAVLSRWTILEFNIDGTFKNRFRRELTFHCLIVEIGGRPRPEKKVTILT